MTYCKNFPLQVVMLVQEGRIYIYFCHFTGKAFCVQIYFIVNCFYVSYFSHKNVIILNSDLKEVLKCVCLLVFSKTTTNSILPKKCRYNFLALTWRSTPFTWEVDKYIKYIVGKTFDQSQIGTHVVTTELDRENLDFPSYLISHGQKIGSSRVLLATRSEVAYCVCVAF